MNIKTKYEIGQKVYAVFKEKNEIWVKVFDDVILQIVIDEDGITYYLEKMCEEFKEEDIIPITNSEALVERIDYLLKGDNND